MIEEADGKIRDIRFPRVRAYSPDAHRVDTPSGTWLLWLPWGHGPRSLLGFLENTVETVSAARELCRVSPEITGVFVPCGTGRNPLAFRSLSSGFELFCLQAPGGGIILTDFFRDALALLPREERQLEITGIADYLLAQCPLDEQTLVRGISRLPSGALWEWTTAGVPPRRSIIESLEDLLEETPHPSVVEALSSAMDPLSGSRDIALLFSGGIDSALIGSFLDPETEALTALAAPPELAFEHGLAREGAGFLGLRRVREIPFAEDRFLDDLSAAIRTTGLPVPCPNFQALFHETFFRSPHAAYCSGDMADSLFGYCHVELGRQEESEWTGILDELFPEGGSLRELGTKGLFSGARVVVDFLGQGVVSGRLRDRHRLLAEQVGDLTGISCPFDLSAEWGRLAWVLCNPYWRHYFRQQATAFGKSLVCPFAQRDVMRAALSLPLEARSPKGGPLKAILRNLLAKRVPGYPVDRPKGGNGVPRTRYCTTGPLAGFFDGRSCPRALPCEILPLLRKPAWETSGAVMNLAVLKLWEESCLEADNPVPHPPRLTLP